MSVFRAAVRVIGRSTLAMLLAALPTEFVPSGPAGRFTTAAPWMGTGYNPLCNCSSVTAALRVADKISVIAGYRAEYLVPPSVLNMPTDVVVRSDGTMVVNSGRSGKILLVTQTGRVTDFAHVQNSYALDTDAAGNIYSYHFPGGRIQRITPGGADVIAEVAQTPWESDLALAPDGTLYVALNSPGGRGTVVTAIWVVPPTGQRRQLSADLGEIAAIDVGPDGYLYAAIGNTLYRVASSSGAGTVIARLPIGGSVSFHGLAATEDGFYISTGDMQPEGRLYRVSKTGQVSVVATIPGNGLSGLAVLPNGDVVGVQRCAGGLLRVRPDGQIQEIITPNGLVSPQSLTVLPCGELVVVNDEAGWASIVCPDGTVRPFVEMISFMPPLTHVAASIQGWIVAGESAPGDSRLARYNMTGTRTVLAQDLPGVSGVAVAQDGTIFAAVTKNDQIVKLSPGGQRSVVANVRRPLGLALSQDGTLYAIVNQNDRDEEGTVFPRSLSRGDAVVAIGPEGAVRVVAQIADCHSLAIDEAGLIYVAAETVVRRVDKNGWHSVFASGFSAARGVAYHAGAVYVTDDVANCIVKITRTGG